MADFLSYTTYRRTERRVSRDGVVELSAERWQWLVDFIRVNYGITQSGVEITVHEPTVVNSVMFLPAHYRGPDEADPLAFEAPPPIAPTDAYQIA